MDTERNRKLAILRVNGGFLWEDMDLDRHKKGPMYRHKPTFNVQGVLQQPCGTVLPNQPLTIDHFSTVAPQGLRNKPFRGVCVLKECECRKQLGEERFAEAMAKRGLDPDKVGPGADIQFIEPPQSDLHQQQIVANAEFGNLVAAEAARAKEAETKQPEPEWRNATPREASIAKAAQEKPFSSKVACVCGFVGKGKTRKLAERGLLFHKRKCEEVKVAVPA